MINIQRESGFYFTDNSFKNFSVDHDWKEGFKGYPKIFALRIFNVEKETGITDKFYETS